MDDYLKARGRDRIIDLRRKRLYLALVSYGLFYQRIFVFDMITSFKNRHFKLSLDTSHVIFVHFSDSFQEDIRGD